MKRILAFLLSLVFLVHMIPATFLTSQEGATIVTVSAVEEEVKKEFPETGPQLGVPATTLPYAAAGTHVQVSLPAPLLPVPQPPPNRPLL